MKLPTSIFLLSALFLTAAPVPLDSANIITEGAHYITRTKDNIKLERFAKATLATPRKELGVNADKARSLAGAAIRFKTNAKTIVLTFALGDGPKDRFEFAVFVKGKKHMEKKFFKPKESIDLVIKAPSPGIHEYQVFLPMKSQPELIKFDIDDGAKLQQVEIKKRKTYLAIGDSITHGVGQDYSYQSYAPQLAKHFDAELFNLAVGGGKVSVPIANMTKDWKSVDFITVLIGYNDLHFDKKSPETYKEAYVKLLKQLSSHHPKAKIFCISPLFTKKPINTETKVDIKQFREVVTQVVAAQANPNITLIEGDTISSIKNLRADQPKDPVHLGIDGAGALATALIPHLEKQLK